MGEEDRSVRIIPHGLFSSEKMPDMRLGADSTNKVLPIPAFGVILERVRLIKDDNRLGTETDLR